LDAAKPDPRETATAFVLDFALAVDFFAGAFFAGAFFAGDFFAGDFFAGDFFALLFFSAINLDFL